MPKIIRNRNRLELVVLLFLPMMCVLLFLVPLAGAPVLAAALAPDCSVSAGSLYCRLLGVLNILYGVAAVLGVVLVLIAVFAYVVYRRNRTVHLGAWQTDTRKTGRPRRP